MANITPLCDNYLLLVEPATEQVNNTQYKWASFTLMLGAFRSVTGLGFV